MKQLNTRQAKEKIEKPKKLNPRNVCYWAEQDGILIGTMKGKAKRFIEEGCVKRLNKYEWDVLPIPGYNKTTHHIHFGDMIKCSCQFNKSGKECSHIMAVKLVKFMEDWNGNDR